VTQESKRRCHAPVSRAGGNANRPDDSHATTQGLTVRKKLVALSICVCACALFLLRACDEGRVTVNHDPDLLQAVEMKGLKFIDFYSPTLLLFLLRLLELQARKPYHSQDRRITQNGAETAFASLRRCLQKNIRRKEH
jgi:hypothetical protein